MLLPPLLICRLWAFDGLAKIGEELLNAPDRTLVTLYLPLPAVPGATASIPPPGLGRGARPPGDLPALCLSAAACPLALARSDPPNLARELLGEPEVAIRPGRDAERLARQSEGELGDGACCGPGGSAAQAQQADRGNDSSEKGGQARPQTRTIHVSFSFVYGATHGCLVNVSSSLQHGSAWAACCARKASPGTIFIQPPGLGRGREASAGCARLALLSPGLLSRTAVRSDLLFTKLLEQGLRSLQTVHSSEGANRVGAPQPNLVCGTTPARQARLKERGGPDARTLDAGVLGCIQLGAGEVVVVAIQSAGDQHLPVWEQGRCVLNAGGMQATGGGPGTCRRIVAFGAGDENGPVLLTGDQHLPVREQGSRVLVARGVQATCAGPGRGGRVVQLRAGERADRSRATGDEDLTIGEQGGAGSVVGGVHAAGGGPAAGGGVVEFGAGVLSADDEHLAVGEQGRRGVRTRDMQAAG
jgi:hypothetical protein